MYSDTQSGGMGAAGKGHRFIALVEGRALARESICRSIESALSLPVVMYSTASGLEHQFRDATAELVVLSLADIDHTAIANILDLLSKLVPKVPVIVLAEADDVDLARTAIRHGAKGFIPCAKGVAIAVEAMRLVLGGTLAPTDCLSAKGQPSIGTPQSFSSTTMRFSVEAGLAALCGFLAVLTLFTRDWIEAVTGFDPDNNNASFEWTIVAAPFLLCILLSIAARADWRRLRSFARAGI